MRLADFCCNYGFSAPNIQSGRYFYIISWHARLSRLRDVFSSFKLFIAAFEFPTDKIVLID